MEYLCIGFHHSQKENKQSRFKTVCSCIQMQTKSNCKCYFKPFLRFYFITNQHGQNVRTPLLVSNILAESFTCLWLI